MSKPYPKPNCSYQQYRETLELYFKLVSVTERRKAMIVTLDQMTAARESFFNMTHAMLKDLNDYFTARLAK